MNKLTTSTAIPPRALKLEALSKISASFELFCLASGMEALGEMMDRDAQAICGPRHARGRDRRAYRWGKTKGKIGFHGGKVEIERPRLRGFDGKEQPVPSWEAAVAEDWLGKWAMNQMLINVATRKFARSVRLPEGDVPGPAGAGLSKSTASRRFVALSAARMKDWMASDLSGLDLLVIQIDGIHMDEDLILVAAIGVDARGDKHPLGLAEGATENAATVQSLIDNLVEGRRLDPGRHRRNPHRHAAWIAEGAAALARLYQHHRECHEHGAARMPEREAMALGLDGDALDRGRHAGSSQRLPPTEGSQAASNVAGRSGSSSQQRLTRPCSPSHRRLTSISAATASQMFNKKRDIPQAQCSPPLPARVQAEFAGFLPE